MVQTAVCVATTTEVVVHGLHKGLLSYRYDQGFHLVQEVRAVEHVMCPLAGHVSVRVCLCVCA